MATTPRPRVFLDISIAFEPVGRVTIELFPDKAPKASENFRALCSPSSADSPTYKGNQFHRVIDEFMVQAGDITNNDGTGGKSIWGHDFEEENIGWRDVDKEGLLCMVNRGKASCNSQFFITLVPCEHLNGKHTVFGHVVSGMDAIQRVALVEVGDDDRPTVPVLISYCGELERRKKTATGPTKQSSSTEARGRRVPSRSQSIASSSSTSSRQQRENRDERRSPSPATRTLQAAKKRPRRRSDHSIDENLRGRVRRRSRGSNRSTSVIDEADESRSPRRLYRRGREPSRSPQREERIPSDYRRRTSLPNHRERWERRHRDRCDGRRDQSSRSQERRDGRLDGAREKNNGSGSSWASGGEIKFKGRGSMKYRERW